MKRLAKKLERINKGFDRLVKENPNGNFETLKMLIDDVTEDFNYYNTKVSMNNYSITEVEYNDIKRRLDAQKTCINECMKLMLLSI